MNRADSEKVDAVLFASGLHKTFNVLDADIVIVNTCSVRKKGEDRVYSLVHDIAKASKKTGKKTIMGITGCMVRKTGLQKTHYQTDTEKIPTKIPKHIQLLTDEFSLFNSDDQLLKKDSVDFVFRIEETGQLPKILSAVLQTQIGNDAKIDEYLRLKQLREKNGSANVIIQTGCDNFCTFCIVPHTRGRETSRDEGEIIKEVQEAVKNGHKEVILL